MSVYIGVQRYVDMDNVVEKACKVKAAYIGFAHERFQLAENSPSYSWEYVGIPYGVELFDNERWIVKEQQTGKDKWHMNNYGITKQVEIEVTSNLQDFVMECTNGTPTSARGMGTFKMTINCDGTDNDHLDIRHSGSGRFPEGREPMFRIWVTPKSVARRINKMYVGVPSADSKCYAKLCYKNS